MLKNMKVKKSLILGYGITIVISVALIIASLMMMNNQRGQYEMLMNEDVETNMAILFISHNLQVVRKLCTRVAVMQGGHLVEEGLVEDIFRAPQQEYTRQLIAAIPTRDKKLT